MPEKPRQHLCLVASQAKFNLDSSVAKRRLKPAGTVAAQGGNNLEKSLSSLLRALSIAARLALIHWF